MRFMPVREFLRGGYQKINEPTCVTSRGYPLFSVFPGLRERTDYPRDGVRDTVPKGPPGLSPNGG